MYSNITNTLEYCSQLDYVVTVAYNELVVNFLRRPDIFDLIPRRFHQPITPDLRALIETIQMTGTSAMDELASRPRMLDLTIILR